MKAVGRTKKTRTRAKRVRGDSSVEIVDFKPALARAFKRLNLEWLEANFEVEPLDQKVLADPKAHYVDSGGMVLFAKVNGRVMGTCALRNMGRGVFELCKMAVTASARGHGLGEKLGRAIIARATKLGGKKLVLESHHSLVRAVRLYERLGFVHKPHVHRTFKRTDVYMEIPLKRRGK